jgi:phosphatidylglycerol---prolipoprotein diacylglyceryl transferase
MHPYLFEIAGRQIPTWGVVIVTTVIGVILLGNHLAKKDGGYPKDLAFEAAIIIFSCHTIGGRIGYVRANWGKLDGDWKKVFDITSGGSAFLESFLLIVAVFAVYLWWRRIPILNLFDLCATMVPLGQGVGRLACIMAGCCYGRPTDLPWGMTFTHAETLARPTGVALHPTQIYEMIWSMGLFAFLLWFRPRRTFRGQVTLMYFTLFPVLRFINEFFRGDPKRGWFMEDQIGQVLSNPQAISLMLLVLVAVGWVVLPRLPGARDLNLSGAPKPREGDAP